MLTTIAELQQFAKEQHRAGKRIGLVPTMGALHEGHLSLVQVANEQCDTTVVSIFVNPTQFAPNEDFHRYPRPLENDLRLLQTAGSPEVFAPSVEEMYPSGFDVSVHVGGVTQILEGAIRPTHFAGVATVVLKLFLASGADAAFFGQKDYQQVCVIKKMVADLNVPIEIAVCPIIREPDGLAMSSRNRYLSESERKQAVVLSKSLGIAEKMMIEQKMKDVSVIRDIVRKTIQTAPDMVIDYVSICEPVTLRELTTAESAAVILLAAKIGTTRLIDNAVVIR
jgi:pantoate--beta-alanine ligase